MTQRTMTALFDSREDAEEAREDLLECGIASGDINIVSQSASTTTSASSGASSGGLWGGIKDLFIGDDDRSAYAEGVNRGGFLLTARVDLPPAGHGGALVGELAALAVQHQVQDMVVIVYSADQTSGRAVLISPGP